MTAVIVDDESKNRASLKKLCEKYVPDLTIEGLADSVATAKQIIDRADPDLVFLDIRMPVEDGFELLKKYEDVPFDVIFTTAYDQYAIKAFRFSAIDYLLKPISIQELQAAVEKVRKKKGKTSSASKKSNISILKENLATASFDKIALPTTEGFSFVKTESIMRCEASGNYTIFYLLDKTKYVITRTLKHYEEMLVEHGFFRVHKSHLINLTYVQKFIRGKQGYVQMIDGKDVEVSTRKREELLNRLGL
ncbi:MAG: LytR/AlgR family response regulator transcription factor [Saprospiraceae bacterium]